MNKRTFQPSKKRRKGKFGFLFGNRFKKNILGRRMFKGGGKIVLTN